MTFISARSLYHVLLLLVVRLVVFWSHRSVLQQSDLDANHAHDACKISIAPTCLLLS